MYRYSVDQTISYTSDDVVLFRESAFASWMERLTLENPSHGILPDADAQPTPAPDDCLEQTLAAEGKNVIAIDWDSNEAMRRTATLAAMRHGVDFIVNGQLAVGPLSDSVSLLMRTSGYSELGNYLYIPCASKSGSSSVFRLCYLADLLHSLQGQLPPQMLILGADSGVEPIQSDDHIYHYRAVKQRFMAAQSAFRKHRMPDPLEAAHFGRWSECANKLLKQRALGRRQSPQFVVEEESREEVPLALRAHSLADTQSTAYDLDTSAQLSVPGDYSSAPKAGTLAEQARSLAAQPAFAQVLEVGSDSLENLEFIGSSQFPPMIGDQGQASSVQVPTRRAFKAPPPPSLRNPANVDLDVIQNLEPEKRVSGTPFSDNLITNRDRQD